MEAPFKRSLLKRGDIVVYKFPKSPQWHGTLAIAAGYTQGEYPVQISEYLFTAPGFPYSGKEHGGPWKEEAWEKIGEVPDADI